MSVYCTTLLQKVQLCICKALVLIHLYNRNWIKDINGMEHKGPMNDLAVIKHGYKTLITCTIEASYRLNDNSTWDNQHKEYNVCIGSQILKRT